MTKGQNSRAKSKRKVAKPKRTGGQSSSTMRSQVPAAYGAQVSYSGPVIRTLHTGGQVAHNSGSLVTVMSAGTAGTENPGTASFNVRNSTNLPWLANMGQLYAKYRVLYAHFTWEPIVGTNVNGEICMALLYDQAELAVSSLPIARLMNTSNSIWSPVWKPSSQPMKLDASQMALKWYLSGTTTGVAAGNMQTPFVVAYCAQSSSVNTALGRIMVRYGVEFIEPIDPAINQ
nr:MAG: coat protein [Sobemovirus sp.]